MFVSQVTVTFLLHVEETVMLFCGIVQVCIFKVELAKRSLLAIVFVGLHLLKSIISLVLKSLCKIMFKFKSLFLRFLEFAIPFLHIHESLQVCTYLQASYETKSLFSLVYFGIATNARTLFNVA